MIARRWPLGLLGMIAIVVAVEASVARHPLAFTESAAFGWAFSRDAARGEARSAEVLCFGDSLAKHGLLPEVIEERLGATSYNLATPSATAPAHYYLLRHALAAGARPRAVVVDFMPGMLAGAPDYAARNWPELLTTAEALDLARTWRNPHFFVQTMLAKLLPTARARWELGHNLRTALDATTDPLASTNRMLRRNWSIHRGAQFTQDNPAWTGEPTEAEHAKHLSDRFWCHPLNRSYVERFLRLAELRGIRVYWLLPPSSPKIQIRREASGADAKYTRFVREMARGHPGVIVLDARSSAYDHTKFVDPIHLTGKGALGLTADVADAIASRPSPWVALPPFRDRKLAHPFEDLEQSRIAIAGRVDLVR